jgi:hypothetical protein
MTEFGRNHGQLQMVRAVVRTIKTGSRVEKGSDNSCYQANDCVAGYSNSEIMEQLSISERTLYRRLAEAVDADWQRLRERDDSHKLALQISILEDRLNAAYRRLVAIATSPKTSARQKVEAEFLAAHCAVAILQVVVAGPLMIRRLTKELDISHFGESFDADESDIVSSGRIKLAEKACSK